MPEAQQAMIGSLFKLKARWPWARGVATRAFTLPPLLLEIQPDFVAGARVQSSGRAPRRLQRLGVDRVEAGSLQAQFSRTNIVNPTELQRALRAVTDVVGNGSCGAGLLIPDGAVRVSMLSFETLPDDPAEREALVRWKLREMLPFSPDEARASYQVVRWEPGKIEVLAVAAKASVLSEYELSLEPLDSGAVLILPVTLALLPFLPEEPEGAQLLVHVCSGWMTSAVVAGGGVPMWRTREVARGPGDDFVNKVGSEVARVLAAARDLLKMEVGAIRLCGRPPLNPEFCRELAGQVSREIETLELAEEFASGLSTDEHGLFNQFGAPLAGLLLNAR